MLYSWSLISNPYGLNIPFRRGAIKYFNFPNELTSGKLILRVILIIADYRSFLALGCLAYMIPDVRTKTDYMKVFTFLEVLFIATILY